MYISHIFIFVSSSSSSSELLTIVEAGLEATMVFKVTQPTRRPG